MPFDHVAFRVPKSKFDGLVTFLLESLKHMGFKEHMRPMPDVVGLGEERHYFWLSAFPDDDTGETKTERGELGCPDHIAFAAKNVEQVDEFHAAALKAGATCNGPPGFRPNYHPNYYGAFVRDPACGINFEVVCHSAVPKNE